MSFFDRQDIPEVLIRNRAVIRDSHRSQKNQDEYKSGQEEENSEDSASKRSEDDGFEDDVQTLRDYSFLSISTDETFEMHALVQLATRKWLKSNGKLEQWKQQYIKNLSIEFPTEEYENWTYCYMLFPHAKSAAIQRPKAEKSLKE